MIAIDSGLNEEYNRWSAFQKLLSVLTLLLLSTTLHAQHTVVGSISDGTTNQPLPATNVQVAGTYRGTVTNSEGRFVLLVDELPATLLIRFIGYEAEEIEIEDGDDFVRVNMTPVVYELGELTVSAENPATNIMRKVIERKQEWRKNLGSWEANAYTRFVARNDTGIVGIMESASTAFWDKDRGFRELALGSRTTDNLDLPEQIPAAVFVTDLYDDDIEIFGFRFLGPTHPDALDKYRFRLTGRRRLGNQTVYDIAVESRSPLVPLFNGSLSVLDSVYALLEVDLQPNEAFFFPVPLNDVRVSYQQQYSDFGKDYWLPVDFRSVGEIELGIPGLRFPTIRFEQLSRIADYQVNVAVPDTLFEKDRLVTQKMAGSSDSTRFQELISVIPLSTEESSAYNTIDSTFTMEKAYEPSGALAKIMKTEANMSDDNEADPGEPDSKSWRIAPQVWYNRVDGLYLAVRPGLRMGRFSVHPEVGRGFGSGKWTTGIRGHVDGDRIDGEIGFREGSVTRMPSDFHTRTIAGLGFLAGAPDYFDYYYSRSTWAKVRVRPPGVAPHFSVAFRAERHKNLPEVIGHHVFGFGNLRPNQPIAGGTLNSVRFTVGKGVPTSFIAGGKHAQINVEVSREEFGSDFDFVVASGQIDWRFVTFGSRRLISNAFDVRIRGFTSTGSVPGQRLVPIETSIAMYRPYGAMRSGGGIPFEGDEGVAVFWEHHFRTLPFEMLGMRRIARMGTSLSLFGGHARTRLRAASAASLGFPARTTNGYRHEVGLALSNVLSIPLRVEVTRSIDPGEWYFGFGLARVF